MKHLKTFNGFKTNEGLFGTDISLLDAMTAWMAYRGYKEYGFKGMVKNLGNNLKEMIKDFTEFTTRMYGTPVTRDMTEYQFQKLLDKFRDEKVTESTETEEKTISEELLNHLGFDPSGLTDFFVPLEDLGCKVELKYSGFDADYEEGDDEDEGEVILFEYKTGTEWVEYTNNINDLKDLRFSARIDKPKSVNDKTFNEECNILKKTLDNKFIVKMQLGEVEDRGVHFTEDCFVTFKPNPKEWND